jgi:hypothetical protein
VAESQTPPELFCSINVGAAPSGESLPAPPASPGPDAALTHLLAAVVEQNRELIALARRQLEISQRMEERFDKQIQGQREEFLRWIDEVPGLSARGKKAAEAVRILLGALIEELVAYVEENKDSLGDSDFVRAEMVDRYGQMLNHVSAMYGMLKRLATADDGPPNG